jgi:L,D-transpeptidase YcbB
VRLYFAILFPVIFLTSCGNSSSEKIDELLETETLSFEQKLRQFLEDGLLVDYHMTEDQISWMNDFYRAREFKPYWHSDTSLNEKGKELFFLTANSIFLGIPANRLNFNGKKEDNPVVRELLLTARSAVIVHDLKYGIFEDTVKKYKPIKFPELDSYFLVLEKTDSISYKHLFINEFHADSNYVFLANHLFDYCYSNILDTNSLNIPTFKEDSIRSVELSEVALRAKGYLNDSVEYKDALKRFQRDHGLATDAKLGKYTVEALGESTMDKAFRIALTLDKLRRAEVYPKKFLVINIPEYTLRFYAVDSLKSVHRIIVGTRENQTPELRSRLHTIVVYPYWNVPYSIASKEILPEVQRNVNYLKKHNYRVYKGETEINPQNVNWKKIKRNSFPYKVIQDPGPKNSLGIIKFEFHNKYSVYFHDTPSKSLFNTSVRSYSHGCMRTESPVDLAKLVLTYDSIGKKANPYTADSLDSLIRRAENFPVRLKSPVPVFVQYRTVTADREMMTIHLDIYKRDEEYLKIMRNKKR